MKYLSMKESVTQLMNEMRAPFLQEYLQLLLNPFPVLYRCINECSQQ